MSVRFFSQEWCDGAMAACNASKAMYAGFKDPSTFTNRMAFGVNGRDDLVVHLEWKEGQVTSWTPAQFDEDDLWLIINADIETWKKCADGVSEGGKLLMAGKIKFAKGPMSAAIENGAAFNAFLLAWGSAADDIDYAV
jgi:putative sterol carrier protein